METPFPLRLEELFFPIQEVRANPDHDPKGDRLGTHIKQSLNVQPIEGQAGLYGVDMTFQCDRETSPNPPYFFHLQVYALLRADASLDPATALGLATTTGVNVVIGAARERLLDLTSRAPWGRFMMALVQITNQPVVTGQDQEKATITPVTASAAEPE